MASCGRGLPRESVQRHAGRARGRGESGRAAMWHRERREAPAGFMKRDAFDTWSLAELDAVESALDAFVPVDAPAGLGEAMRYAVLDGGKRLRPLLVLAGANAVGGVRAAALRAACAVELIHAYSLVHDDLPCMDDDVLRRGKPTVHVRYGVAQA